MIKLKVYRSIILVVGIALVFSTSGLSIDAHFCTGKLKRIKVFGNAKTCLEVINDNKSCCSRNKKNLVALSCANGTHSKGCCNNQQVTLDLKLDYKVQQNVSLSWNTSYNSIDLILQLPYIYSFKVIKSYCTTDKEDPPSNKVYPYILFQHFLC